MRFGHIYYREPFSDYHLVVEYRFTGSWLADAPEWARRNSGVMLHSQDARTVRKDQDFPISVEMQFLGGFDDGRARSTGNMCSPGTEVSMNGAHVAAHCVNSSSQTFDGDQWVRAEAIVRGDSITHIINGDTVLGYTSPRIGGGVVNGFDPAVKVDGTPLRSGYIALQGEGHPVEFRKVQLRRLVGPPREVPDRDMQSDVASAPETWRLADRVRDATHAPAARMLYGGGLAMGPFRVSRSRCRAASWR